MIKKFFLFLKAHKIISALFLIVLVGGGYWEYHNYQTSHQPLKYVLAAVTKGTIVTSVSGSGQISSSNQFDLKPKVSGTVLSVKGMQGQQVKTGDILMQLDATDAYKSVRDANANLQSAKLSLAKLTQSATPTQISQAQNDLANAQISLQKLQLSQPIDVQNAQDSIQKAQDNLDKAYADSFNIVTDTFIDLPDALSTTFNVLFGTDLGNKASGQQNNDALLNTISSSDSSVRDQMSVLISRSGDSYTSAKSAYDSTSSYYKNANRTSNETIIDELLTLTLDSTQKLSDTLKNESNTLAFLVNYNDTRNVTTPTGIKTYQTNLNTATSKISSDLSSLLSNKQTIEDDKRAITNAEQTLTTLQKNNPFDLQAAQANVVNKQNSLSDLKSGANTLDVQSSQLSVQAKLNALTDAQQTLADYTIRAPFDGTLAKVSVKKGDSASSGAAVATIITQQQIAEITLNEVDVSKVAVGEKVTLTFDAISGLELTGKVATIDSIGTVAQGVVTYTVQIMFDTQDDRIKSGMSVSAAIMTNVKADVLTVPNAAVKTSSNGSYVLMLDTIPTGADTTSTAGIASLTPPKQVPVQIGISNDTLTEITSGINEGDNVVIRTIDPNAKTAASAGTSLFQATGATRGATGGATRSTGSARPGG